MKKTYHFTELSDKYCDVEGCGRRIKARLADPNFGQKEQHNITKCYRCYSVLKKTEMPHNQIVRFRTNVKHIIALEWQNTKEEREKKEKAAERKALKAEANNA